MPSYVTKTVTVHKSVVVTKTLAVTIFRTAQQYAHTAGGAVEKIVYSGSLYIEKKCRMHFYKINAEKGDVIKVSWESNDASMYIAIGTSADIEQVSNMFCEFIYSGWSLWWPKTGSGYSGSLQYKVPSSGTWYVVVGNGNFGCISECPITLTKLEIRHVKS